MTRHGPPDDSGYYPDDPYGPGNQGRVPPPDERLPWYRTPAAMFAAGVLATLLLVFIIWAVMQTGSDEVPSTTGTPLAPITPTATAPAPAEPATETVTVTETSTAAPVTDTVTESPTDVSTTTSTTVSTTISTTVSTETVTVTETPTLDE